MTAPAHLRIPMSMLQHIEDIDAFEGLPSRRVAALSRDYAPEAVTAIVDALQFAVEHPGHDFAALMPGLPFTNAQIHVFLCKLFLSITARDDLG